MDIIEFLNIMFEMNRAAYNKLEALEQTYLNLTIALHRSNADIEMKLNIITIEKEKLNGEALYLRTKLDSFNKPINFKV